MGRPRATDVAARRLRMQRLSGEPFPSPEAAVAWLGAVQSQDYAGAKWALGQRLAGVTDAALDRCFDDGAILRTHVMRPTWHFVLPADIRWLLELTAPRVRLLLGQYDRQLEIDTALLRRCRAALEAALGDGGFLTRRELAAVLEHAGIVAVGQRMGHLTMHAELDAVLASGPRRGRQHTYALLDLRAPAAPRLDRDEALAELTRRYFTGHGPAQVRDFTWWSGLTAADAKRGIEATGPALVREEIAGLTYWRAAEEPAPVRRPRRIHLLPNYDELIVAYRDRDAALDPAREVDTSVLTRDSIFSNVVIQDGQVWGAWKRRPEARRVVVEVTLLDAMDAAGLDGVRRAAADLSRFLGVPVDVEGLP